jgi:hypothetical protein
MGSSTTYDVRVRMALDDKASRGMGALGTSARKASGEVDQLNKRMSLLNTTAGRVGGAIGAYFGGRAAYSALVKYNSAVEDTTNQLGTVIQLNQKIGRGEAMGKGQKLMEQFREDAKQSAGTMKEMADFAARIVNPVLQAGGTLDDLRNFTKAAVVAGSTLGISAEVASFDINQALRGTSTQRDQLTTSLLNSQGMTTDQFNAMSGEGRLGVLRKALNDDAWKDAAKSFETSFSGVTSTLKDNLEQLAGSVGKPLFMAISESVGEMNTWISRNQGSLQNMAKEFGAILKEAFGYIKSAMSFIWEHRELLMSLAKAWLVGKAAKGIAGGIGNGLLGAVGLISKADAAGGFGALMKSGKGAADALALLAASAFFVADQVDKHQERSIQKGVEQSSLANYVRWASDRGTTGSKKALYTAAVQAGLIQDDGKGGVMLKGGAQGGALKSAPRAGGWAWRNDVSIGEGRTMGIDEVNRLLGEGRDIAKREEMTAALDNVAVVFRDGAQKLMLAHVQTWGFQEKLRASIDNLRTTTDVNITAFRNLFGQIGAGAGSLLGGAADFGKMFKAKPQIHIQQMRVDVASDDPDRFVMGIEGYFQDWLRNPSQPPTAFRGA